jgi:hypothetical protein
MTERPWLHLLGWDAIFEGPCPWRPLPYQLISAAD